MAEIASDSLSHADTQVIEQTDVVDEHVGGCNVGCANGEHNLLAAGHWAPGNHGSEYNLTYHDGSSAGLDWDRLTTEYQERATIEELEGAAHRAAAIQEEFRGRGKRRTSRTT